MGGMPLGVCRRALSCHLRAARDNMPQVVFRSSTCKVGLHSQQNEMKLFGEKLIEVANVSYLSYCKLNSVDPDVKKGWFILGGPWTRST